MCVFLKFFALSFQRNAVKCRYRRLSVRHLPVIVYLFSGKLPEIPG